MNKFALVLSAATLALGAGPALAATVFHHDPGVGFQATNRGAGSAPMGRLTVDSAITISKIGILANLNGNSNMQFLIFDANTGANLFTSSVKAFVDDGETYKWSDAISFTFQTGITYSVGASSSAGAIYRVDELANSIAGFNFLTGNQNIGGAFGSSSFFSGQNCCDVATAFEIGSAPAVPESSTWAMMIAGFGAVGFAMRRRQKVALSFA